MTSPKSLWDFRNRGSSTKALPSGGHVAELFRKGLLRRGTGPIRPQATINARPGWRPVTTSRLLAGSSLHRLFEECQSLSCRFLVGSPDDPGRRVEDSERLFLAMGVRTKYVGRVSVPRANA